jgi:tripeptidyl-peptidase-1
MNVSVEEAESLLKTEYNIYVHADTAKRSLAVNTYSVPAAIKRHIDFITPTVDSSPFELKKIKPKRDLLPDSGIPMPNPPRVHIPGLPAPQTPGSFESTLQSPESSKVVATNDWAWNLTVCPQFVTPACLRELYNAPNGTLDM